MRATESLSQADNEVRVSLKEFGALLAYLERTIVQNICGMVSEDEDGGIQQHE